jgi:bifunctional non-homologous end joining protein LigD
VRLLTRKGLDWTARFQPVADALQPLADRQAIMDGEIVVEDADGRSNFPALQAALSEGRSDLFACYLFDLMWLDGEDLRPLPLGERKARLAELLASLPQDIVRFSEHFSESGSLILKHACRLSFEGIVSKLKDAPYRAGRTGDWIKSKCAKRQEFVIGGYTKSSAMPGAIGSLLLGHHDKGKLVYTGRVGTGYSAEMARDLFTRLKRLRRSSPAYDVIPRAERRKDANWTEPKLVAEVEYGAWTADNLLRHASFQGLREDKDPREVVREAPADAAGPPLEAKITLTHPDRVYWPDAGVTKQGLVDYYTDVWTWIAPHIVGRPLALVRCPGGVDSHCFFQKHAWAGIDTAIRRGRNPEDNGELLYIEDLAGLLNLAQAGVLEIHPWGAKLATIEQPDQMIFDLDPGPGVAWPEVIAAAQDTRERLKQHGLASFVKNTGGKGLHVVVPLVPDADWETAKAFARGLADDMAAADPRRYVATMSKKMRGGRIFVDYVRNGKGATAVAAYSTRARPGAAVSTPLAWEELTPEIGPAHFTVNNIRRRLDSLDKDPWAEFDKKRRPLPAVTTTARRKRS